MEEEEGMATVLPEVVVAHATTVVKREYIYIVICRFALMPSILSSSGHFSRECPQGGGAFGGGGGGGGGKSCYVSSLQ